MKTVAEQSCKAGKLHSADEIISFALDEREYRLSGAFFLEQQDLAPVWRSLLAVTSDVTHIMVIQHLKERPS